MRWVSLPEALAAPYLLDLSFGLHPVRDLLLQIPADLAAGGPVAALSSAARAVDVALSQRNRYAGALALVLRSDLLRRLLRWEDSLDAVRHAVQWLELDVSPSARYNEAIAVYLEGMVHYALRADDKVAATFAYVQSSLKESVRHWDFEHHASRVSDCRNVIRWLSQLAALQDDAATTEVSLVMPVYELADRTLVRTGAIALPPFQLMMPADVVARYCPPHVHPLQVDALAFPSLRPDIQYAAIRVADSMPAAGGGRLAAAEPGDLLIVEVTGTAPAPGELVLTVDQPFVRRGDGRVVFHPAGQGSDPGTPGGPVGLVGIPRVLIKDVEAQ